MDYSSTKNEDTICAISTAHGKGGIAVIRVSGPESIDVTDKIFKSFKDKKIKDAKNQSILYGQILDSDNTIFDDVLVSVFRNPHSFTGEDTIEISCHGSLYIQQKIIEILISKGCRLAKPGEFSKRAFLNGKVDLSQAEAIADLIASNTASAHRIAMKQMRGGFSNELNILRSDLLKFVSLIELELDFSTEDVEFADRQELYELVQNIEHKISNLANSFSKGNAIKNGIPVTIIGKTNVGKSTLLNWLLNEEKAIVSDINGTTRDVIEDTLNINGTIFRLIDTAGIRETEDKIERLGIERSFKKMDEASIILLMIDATDSLNSSIEFIKNNYDKTSDKQFVILINKIDSIEADKKNHIECSLKDICDCDLLFISARNDINKQELIDKLKSLSNTFESEEDNVIVSNLRHFEALTRALDAIKRVEEGLDLQLSGDLLSQDIHDCIDALSEITGEISSDDVLANIFKNFCIGK